MTVTPLGVDDAFAPADPECRCELPPGVTPPFLLHVGDLHERRNLPMLVEALLAARRHFGALPAAVARAGGTDLGVGDASARMAPQRARPMPSFCSVR